MRNLRKMRFDLLTISPEYFSSVVADGIIKRGIRSGRIEVVIHDIRQYADDKHRTVDDTPYGGGPGMIMKPEPICKAVEDVEKLGSKRLVILFTPRGERLTQGLVKRFATSYDQIIMICGRYEGIDERVSKLVADMEVSIGDYVLSAGEPAAAVTLDAVSRLIKGVLGNADSKKDESFESGMLEYPQYTRPMVYKGLSVPAVLLTGNHNKIKEWRKKAAYTITKDRRPDLIDKKESL